MYIRWVLLLVLNQLTNVINYPLAPVVVLFADANGWLPDCLWWFQTPDNSLNGDYLWKVQNRPYLDETNAWKRWVNQYSWLHRNKLYGFSRAVLGFKYKPATDIIYFNGDDTIRDTPSPAKEGGMFKYINRVYWNKRDNTHYTKKVAFQYYYIKQYKRFPNRCIRVLLGWKLGGIQILSNNGIASFGFSISPWKRFDV